MAYREITSGIDIRKQEGQPFEGIYQGSTSTDGQYGESTTHHFVGLDGVPFSLYSFTSLTFAMARVPKGSKCRITFTGKRKTKDGKKDINTCRVEVDDSHDDAPPSLTDEDIDRLEETVR